MTADWGIPTGIISDRDTKFLSEFWQTIFKLIGVRLLMTTAYHPQADGQSERTNQTVEEAIRMFVYDNPDVPWIESVPSIQHMMNNSQNATGSSATEIMYGQRVREAIDAFAPTSNASAERLVHRNEASQAIALAQAASKGYYDRRHRPIVLQPGTKVYLRLGRGYKTPESKGKLGKLFEGPFKIVERVGKLAYRLDIPEEFSRIHPVVSIAHLKPAPPGADPYNREATEPGPVAVEGDNEEWESYEVERILSKRTIISGGKKCQEYRIKWKGYDDTHNQWYPAEALSDSKDLIVDFEARREQTPAPPPPRRKDRGKPAHRGGQDSKQASQPNISRSQPSMPLPEVPHETNNNLRRSARNQQA